LTQVEILRAGMNWLLLLRDEHWAVLGEIIAQLGDWRERNEELACISYTTATRKQA